MIRDGKQILTEWLVLAARTGDEAAFRDLYALWQADLRRLCVARIGQVEDSDEILNEAWLAIARGLRGLEDPALFPAWAFRIVQLRSIDWIRRRARERRHAAEVEAGAEELQPAAVVAPVSSAASEGVQGALAALPAAQRELADLYYFSGCNVAEIAHVLGVPSGTVKSRLHALRASLKSLLERKTHE